MAVSTGAAFGAPPPPPPPNDDRALDDALRKLQRQEPFSKLGLSTHAPMAAEALCALGLADRALPWIDAYDEPLERLPLPTAPIEAGNWRAALGPRLGVASWTAANERYGDWVVFFTREIEGQRWQDVLDLWVGRLAPGMHSAATHGVIRTGHAARGLGARESPERRAELARGLAYWASSYEELPASARTAAARSATFAEALRDVPLYWEAFGRSPEGRNIVEELRHLRELDRFAEVRDALPPPADVPAALSALTATFARVYLRHGTERHTIGFIHGVTGPASLRRIAPHIRSETARAAFPYAWQAAAAIFSAYARSRDFTRPEETGIHAGELRERAVRNGDAHAIKFTEVMLAEHALNPDPIYLAAAADVVGRL